jgi:anti-anti-sigma factor
MSLRSWIRNLFAASGQAVPSGASPHPPAPPGRPCAGRSSTRASRLAVEVCELANEVLIRLRGEAGYLEAAILDAALMPVRARRPALVTFDLSELRFLSSLALGLLVGCHRSAARTGGRVRLIGLRPAVREVIERTGLAMLLLEHDGAQAAGTCEVAATVRAAGPADTLNP